MKESPCSCVVFHPQQIPYTTKRGPFFMQLNYHGLVLFVDPGKGLPLSTLAS